VAVKSGYRVFDDHQQYPVPATHLQEPNRFASATLQISHTKHLWTITVPEDCLSWNEKWWFHVSTLSSSGRIKFITDNQSAWQLHY